MITCFIILVLSVGIYIPAKYYIKANEKPHIIRIPGAQQYDLQNNNFSEYYIIVNPPKDILELKEMIKKFNEEHSIEEENAQEFQEYKAKYSSENSIELKKAIELYKKYNMKIEQSVLNEIKDGQVSDRYLRVFLEETKYLPRDWQPDGGDDIIDDHVSDIIAKVSWQKDDIKAHYIIGEREKYKLFDKKRNRKILDELIVTE